MEKALLIEGIRMRWHEEGEGLPLVLVHGIPTGPRLWRHVVPLVGAGRCLAWEMVGYGESIPEGRVHEISISRQADYLLDWLAAIDVERAVLAGHDLGGGVVQIAAVRKPEVCAGLFLTNAIGYDSWPIPSIKAMRAVGGLLWHLPNAWFRPIPALFLQRGHDNREQAAEALRVHWPAYARHDGAAAFVRQIRALDVRDTLAVADRLCELRIPARIVWGASDQFQNVRYGERFSRDLSAPLRRIEGGRHFTPEDHPDIVAEEINGLLEEVQAGSS